MPKKRPDGMLGRAHFLGLWGLIQGWDKYADEPWLPQFLNDEEEARLAKSLERRITQSKIKKFRLMADFDWHWPKKIDRQFVEELFSLDFMTETANVILVGPNAVGKTMIAKNLAHQALLRGHTVLFTTASEMLNDLAAQESAVALQRRLKRYTGPGLLVVDEVGYLSYDNRHADLLFEVVTRRYSEKSIVLTTNKPFKEWSEVFPNATCVVTIVDRLVHRSEIVEIRGASYRAKEAKERAQARTTSRSQGRPKNTKSKK